MNFKSFVKKGMKGNNLAMLQDEKFMEQVKLAYLTIKKDTQTMPKKKKEEIEKQYRGSLSEMFKESYEVYLKEINNG